MNVSLHPQSRGRKNGEQPQAKPDLVIENFDPDPKWPWAGDRVEFDVTVSNRGNAPSEAFKVEVSGDGMRRTSKQVDGLEAGEQKRLKIGSTRVHFDGLYRFRADADSENQVEESREDNNWMITHVSVRDPWPPRDPFPPRPPIPPTRP